MTVRAKASVSGWSRMDHGCQIVESIRKFRLTLTVAGGMMNSALYNMGAGHRAVIFDLVSYSFVFVLFIKPEIKYRV